MRPTTANPDAIHADRRTGATGAAMVSAGPPPLSATRRADDGGACPGGLVPEQGFR
jgi:hypothetical protein